MGAANDDQRSVGLPAFRFGALGRLEVWVDGRPVPIGSAKQRAVLAVLVLHVNTVVPAEDLVARLWGEQPPPSARATLRTLVARLRRTLGDAIGDVTAAPVWGRDTGYVLEAGPQQLDVHQFERLTIEARKAFSQERTTDAAGLLRSALELWRGPAFADLPDDRGARLEAHRLEEIRLAALEDLADAELALGHPVNALALLEPHLASYPLRERPWGQLMLTLYRLGRQAEALGTYQRVRQVLADELGIEPYPALRDLEQAILQQRPDLDAEPALSDREPPDAAHRVDHADSRPGPRRASEMPRHNLPVELTSFVGRVEEIERIDALLGTGRLLTLTGAGGAGKTRLALQVSAQGVDRFPDGVWLAELGSIHDGDLLVATVTRAIGLVPSELGPIGQEPEAALAERLRHRRLLLVLDNCEHLIEPAAQLVHALLTRCPEVFVLATSRELLQVPGEVVFRVPPLSLPAPDSARPEDLTGSDAVTLFCERAQLAESGFALSGANARAVAQICRHLDGMPLALELAAARIPIIGANQIADRLDQRLRLLGAGARTATPRHQTLRATIDWSYHLLPPGEQMALRRLSAFPGDFDLPAAEAVIGPDHGADDLPGTGFHAIDLLVRLINKSLLVASGEEEVRYRLLETIREYAEERAVETDEARAIGQRHRDHFLATAVEWTHEVFVRWNKAPWLDRASADFDNFRSALEWSLRQGDDEALLQLAAPLGEYWMLSGHTEGRAWLERAVAVTGAGPARPRVAVRMYLAYVLRDLGRDGDRSVALLQEAVSLAVGDDHMAGHARFHWAEYLLVSGRSDEAEALVRETLRAYIALGSTSGEGFTHYYLAWFALSRGDVETGRQHLEVGLALARRGQDDYLALHVLSALALASALTGDHDHAEQFADQAMVTARPFPARQILVGALTRAAETALVSQRPARAMSVLDELLRLLRTLGTRRWLAAALEMTAVVVATASPGPARQLLGFAQALRELLGEPFDENGMLAELMKQCLDQTEQALGPAAAAAEHRGGRLLAADEAVAVALGSLVAAMAEPGNLPASH